MMVNWLSFYYASMRQTEPTVTRAPQQVDGQKKIAIGFPRLTKMDISVRSPRSCSKLWPLHPSTQKKLFKKKNPMLAGFWFQHLWLEAHCYVQIWHSLYGFGNPPPAPAPTSSPLRLTLQSSWGWFNLVTKVLLERGMDRSHTSSQCILPELITKNPKKNCFCVPSPTTYLTYYTTHAAGRQERGLGMDDGSTSHSANCKLSLSLSLQSVNLTERK